MKASRRKTNPESYHRARFKYVRNITLCAITTGLLGYFSGVFLPHLSLHPHGNTVLGALAFLGIITILGLTYLLFESAKQIRPYKSLHTTIENEPDTKNELDTKNDNAGITNINNIITPTSALTQTANKIKSAQAQAIMNSLSILLDDDMAKFNLTPRENKVAKLILQGKTYGAIAKQLFLSESTVKQHARSLYEKANVKTRENFSKLIWDELEELASTENNDQVTAQR